MSGLHKVNPVPGKIDGRKGRELGLSGQYSDLPAYQIVNDAHGAFGLLTSRLLGLEHGEDGDRIKRDPRWTTVEEERKKLADQFRALGNNAEKAAGLSDSIRTMNRTIDEIASPSRDEGRGE